MTSPTLPSSYRYKCKDPRLILGLNVVSKASKIYHCSEDHNPLIGLESFTTCTALLSVRQLDMDSRLRNLWAQVLDIDDSDLDEDTNFFEAGGDSVTALRLVAAAQATHVSLDIEDVFNYPTLGELAKNCQEGSHLSKTEDPASEVSVLDQETLEACATAYKVERNTIEDIFPASPIQKNMFEAGRSYGTYIAQWVFQICGELDRSLLIEAWDRLQKKNQILRTRLVKKGDDHLQAVINSETEWQEGRDLAEHRAKSLSQPLESGRLLFCYAIITEGDDSYFVWTAHHCGFDGWTRRLIFEHLQESLSRPLEYSQRSNGPSYKSFITWFQGHQNSTSPAYWESLLEGFQGFGCVFPLSLPKTPTTTSSLSRNWSPKSVHKSKFTMASIAHAAWAISLGNMSAFHDIFFCTMRSGRHAPIPGVESIYGPLLAGVPVRIVIEKEQPLGDFVQGAQTQLFSVAQHERYGYAVAGRLFGLPQLSQCYLSWHPHDEDALSKDLTYKSRGGSAVTLKPRRDLSTPFSANFGLVLDVYEHKTSLDLYISWDNSLRSQSNIEQLMETFVHNLDQLVGSSCRSVGDLWPGRWPRWVY